MIRSSLKLKKKKIRGEEGVYLVGYSLDNPGCFSFYVNPFDEVTVVAYEESPREVVRKMEDQNATWDISHTTIPIYPGWGFKAIGFLRNHLGL